MKGHEQVNELVDARMIRHDKAKRPDVPIHAPLHNNNVPTFDALYQVMKDTTDRDRETIFKADRNVLQRLITAYEAGCPVVCPLFLKYEFLKYING